DRRGPAPADGRSRDPCRDRGDQGRTRREHDQGHGPRDGRAEGPAWNGARHGPGQRVGEGEPGLIPQAFRLRNSKRAYAHFLQVVELTESIRSRKFSPRRIAEQILVAKWAVRQFRTAP